MSDKMVGTEGVVEVEEVVCEVAGEVVAPPRRYATIPRGHRGGVSEPN